MLSSWAEQSTLTRRLSVAIIVPAGVGSGDFTIAVVGGRQLLQLAGRWPQPLVDVLAMHLRKLTDSQCSFMPYHPSVLGFEASLRELRKLSPDAMESVARTPLPFAVQSQVV